ncbi:MAG: hypothetical protein IJ770_03425 [Alphaproteobacteria bacterium]|nr:hypothetical protein [Alphaproteobacteria bacterium]
MAEQPKNQDLIKRVNKVRDKLSSEKKESSSRILSPTEKQNDSDTKMTENEKSAQIRRQSLLRRAVSVSRQNGSTVLSVDELCKQMVKVSRQPFFQSIYYEYTKAQRRTFGQPVKADYEGHTFVIDENSGLAKALSAWKEQACTPWLEERFSPEFLAKMMEQSAKYTKIRDSSDSYQEAAVAELLVTKYPEHADKLTMLQLLNAYEKSGKQNADTIGNVLRNSAEKYVYNVEETFPQTLENVVTLNMNKDKLASVLVSNEDRFSLALRIAYTELKMLKELKPEDLRHYPDSIIAEGLKIADKHIDAGDFGKMFTAEVKNRLARGNIFDPR